MPRKAKAAGPSKHWAERKKNFSPLQIKRDLAEMMRAVAKDSDPPETMAEIVDRLTRETIEAQYQAILERKLKGLAARRKTG